MTRNITIRCQSHWFQGGANLAVASLKMSHFTGNFKGEHPLCSSLSTWNRSERGDEGDSTHKSSLETLEPIQENRSKKKLPLGKERGCLKAQATGAESLCLGFSGLLLCISPHWGRGRRHAALAPATSRLQSQTQPPHHHGRCGSPSPSHSQLDESFFFF